MKARLVIVALGLGLTWLLACQPAVTARRSGPPAQETKPAPPLKLSPVVEKVIVAAQAQTEVTKTYDPAYIVIPYPNGDVPRDRGVCTDVVVRAFRDGASIDLQKEVHEDMARDFGVYPKKWGLKKPDANIDHRRVPNLMTFFTRRGKALAITNAAGDYQPGDIVAWDLGGGIPHIGLMTSEWNGATGRYSIVHNIGQGAMIEDRLFEWKIIGHYRYF